MRILQAVRIRIHRLLNELAGEPRSTPVGVHPVAEAFERYFTEQGLPPLMDTRSILGFCVGRLLGTPTSRPELVLEYVAAVCEMISPWQAAAEETR